VSTLEFNLVTGVITHCANAVRTFEEITADLACIASSVERAIVDARAAQHDYLRTALTQHADQTVQRLGPCIVRESAVPIIQERVMTVQRAHTKIGLQIAQKQLGEAVHQEQCQIARDLILMVVEASAATGFPAQTLTQPDRILVIGQQRKQALQHELLVVRNRPLVLRSETLGFHDDTCQSTLAQFQDELRKRGVRLQSDRPDRKQRLFKRQAVRACQ